MSGKYEKRNPKTKKSASRKWVWLLLAALVLACVLLIRLPKKESGNIDSTAPETGAAAATAAPEGQTSFSLPNDLEITKLGAYTGLYMEDSSDDVVSGVMMIIVQNNGDQSVQYAEITLSGPAGDAMFKLSTLKPGEQMVVLEAGRKPYQNTDVYTDAVSDKVAFFAEPVSLQEEKLEIQPLEGGFNITNISGQDISGKITVYFKDFADDMLYGGITYRGSIEGGMKAGEIRQIMTQNFSASGSKVVFVTIAEN